MCCLASTSLKTLGGEGFGTVARGRGSQEGGVTEGRGPQEERVHRRHRKWMRDI